MKGALFCIAFSLFPALPGIIPGGNGKKIKHDYVGGSYRHIAQADHYWEESKKLQEKIDESHNLDGMVKVKVKKFAQNCLVEYSFYEDQANYQTPFTRSLQNHLRALVGDIQETGDRMTNSLEFVLDLRDSEEYLQSWSLVNYRGDFGDTLRAQYYFNYELIDLALVKDSGSITILEQEFLKVHKLWNGVGDLACKKPIRIFSGKSKNETKITLEILTIPAEKKAAPNQSKDIASMFDKQLKPLPCLENKMRIKSKLEQDSLYHVSFTIAGKDRTGKAAETDSLKRQIETTVQIIEKYGRRLWKAELALQSEEGDEVMQSWSLTKYDHGKFGVILEYPYLYKNEKRNMTFDGKEGSMTICQEEFLKLYDISRALQLPGDKIKLHIQPDEPASKILIELWVKL